MDGFRRTVLTALATLLLLPSGTCLAQQSKGTGAGTAEAAAKIADIFSKVGDQIYEDCIFELSPETKPPGPSQDRATRVGGSGGLLRPW